MASIVRQYSSKPDDDIYNEIMIRTGKGKEKSIQVRSAISFYMSDGWNDFNEILIKDIETRNDIWDGVMDIGYYPEYINEYVREEETPSIKGKIDQTMKLKDILAHREMNPINIMYDENIVSTYYDGVKTPLILREMKYLFDYEWEEELNRGIENNRLVIEENKVDIYREIVIRADAYLWEPTGDKRNALNISLQLLKIREMSNVERTIYEKHTAFISKITRRPFQPELIIRALSRKKENRRNAHRGVRVQTPSDVHRNKSLFQKNRGPP